MHTYTRRVESAPGRYARRAPTTGPTATCLSAVVARRAPMVVVLAGILALVLATSFPHPSAPMPPPTPIRSAAAPAKNGTESLQTWGGSEPLASAAHALVRAVLRDASRNGSAVSNMSPSAFRKILLHADGAALPRRPQMGISPAAECLLA